jgi:putative spermidine/putrescine transport system permease protein
VAAGLDTAQGLSSTRPGRPLRAARLRVSGLFWRHRWAKALLLLAPPLLAFTLVYLAALAALFVSSFWTVNPFTSEIERIWNLDNFRSLPDYWPVIRRTVLFAATVTVTDAVLAFPLAYFMARVASTRTRTIVFIGVLLPLWSSYLVRVYIWRLILNDEGLLNWTLGSVGLPHVHLAYTNVAVWLVFSYVWLPFMILPIYGSLERIPDSFLEASRDLGASGLTTFRHVIWPLALPGVIAGSIFTFSLTLGDYVTPLLAGSGKQQFIGNVVYSSVGIANNVPFAAALATVPLLVMGVYLLLARRLGAFEAM